MNREKFELLIKAVLDDMSSADNLVNNDSDLVYAKNGIGETVLHFLAVENKIHEVSWLLSKGAEINTMNEFGNTPLSEASGLGYYELCKFLLQKGADPKLKTPEGDTALSEAATKNELKVVNLLLNYIQPEESLRDYFSLITYEVLLNKEGASAKSIHLKGLRW